MSNMIINPVVLVDVLFFVASGKVCAANDFNNVTSPLTVIAAVTTYGGAGGIVFAVGQLFRLGTEIMRVTAVVGNDVTFARGELRTAITAHANGVSIELSNQVVARTLGLPHAPTTTLTAALLLAAGNVTAGTHSYRVTFVDGHDYESPPSPASNIITADGTHQQVSLSGVPLGPSATGNDGLDFTAKRRIYRTVAGNTGSAKLVGEISDNTTTIFTDNVADGSLGVPAPGLSVAVSTSVI